jgi:hypothetical protein
MQANEYELSQGKRMDSFFNSTAGVFTHYEVVFASLTPHHNSIMSSLQVIAWDIALRASRDSRLGNC